MKNQARTTILGYLKLSHRVSTTRPFRTQVTRSSTHSSSSAFPLPGTRCSFNAHQTLNFSSSSGSPVELIVRSDWSDEVAKSLEVSNSEWTHEMIVYVLKRVDKEPEKAWGFFNWVVERDGVRPNSAMYSLLLRSLASMDSKELVWVALEKMKEQGVLLDEETYITLLGAFRKGTVQGDAVALTNHYDAMLKENAAVGMVQAVIGVISGAEWGSEVEKELGDMGIVLSDGFVVRVLRELRNQPPKALGFFRWVGRCDGYEHSVITYNAVLRGLGRDDSIHEFWSVIEEMKRFGHEMDIDTYVKVSRKFQKFRMVGDAVKLYEFMMDGPFKPSAQNCTFLLGAISRGDRPDLDLVDRVVKKYVEKGGSQSRAMYDVIHRSLTSAGKFDEAEKVTKAMRNAGFAPDNITYSQLIFGLCKADKLEEACKVIDDMEADSCKPDLKTWTILIQGHCDKNQIDKAFMCFADMMKKGCDPDPALLQVLVDGLLCQKRIDGAYTLLVELVNKALVIPRRHTYGLLIDQLLEVRKLDEALNLLRLMKLQNQSPAAEPFVRYISKYGNAEDVARFFRALSAKEYPSFAAYLHIFEAFSKEGRLFEAKDLLFKAPHHVRRHPKILELFGSAESADTIA